MKLNFLLCLAFVFCFVACGDDSSSKANDDGTSSGNDELGSSSSSFGPLDVKVTGSGYTGTITYGGQTYKTVRIGTQKWFVENLNYYDENDPFLKDATFCHENKPENCKKYGRLYKKYAALRTTKDVVATGLTSVQGVCPEGWHIATDVEWQILGKHISGCFTENFYSYPNCTDGAAFLKSKGDWNRFPIEPTDPYGFAGHPYGFYLISDDETSDVYFGDMAAWWVSSPSSNFGLFHVYLGSWSNNLLFSSSEEWENGRGSIIMSGLEYYPMTENSAFYVRCLNDSSFHTNEVDSRDPRIPPPVTNEVDPPRGDSTFGSVTYGGQTYKTVHIGSQVWFAENLNYVGANAWDNIHTECPYNIADSCLTLGRIYEWTAAMNLNYDLFDTSAASLGLVDSPHQGICPSGWHIPSEEDFATLLNYTADSVSASLGFGSSVFYYGAGFHLKSKTGWYDGGSGDDAFGFNGYPVKGLSVAWWGSGENQGEWATSIQFTAYSESEDFSLSTTSKWRPQKPVFVRCVNDRTFPIIPKESRPATEVSSSSRETKLAWDYLNPNIDYGTVEDARDAQVYKTVVIGGQTWFAENLNYAVDSSLCYKGSLDSCSKYGRLYIYKWPEQLENACPSGWHVPVKKEWNVLFSFIKSEKCTEGDTTCPSNLGRYLKSSTGWFLDGNGSNDYGFNGLPAGMFNYRNGEFHYSEGEGHWWAFDYWVDADEISYEMTYESDEVSCSENYNDAENFAYSVRCVKDTVVVENTADE